MANKTDLSNEVHELLQEDLKLNKKESTQVVDAVLDAIQNLTVRDGKLQLIGFGNFEVRERAARKGRNPQTGEEIQIEAKRVPAFSAGKQFKEKAK